MLWNADLFTQMERLRRQMDGLMGSYDRSDRSATYPLLNVYEDPSAIVVTAELPGLSKEQVAITFADNVLTIAGKQRPVEATRGMTNVRRERSEGAFEKTVQIPVKTNTDAINAAFTNGILTVTLPKAEEAKPKTITIETK